MKDNLTKKELIEMVSEKTFEDDIEKISLIVQTTFDCMAQTLASGRDIELRNFGIFRVETQSARVGQILRDGVSVGTVAIPARKIIRFKAGKRLDKFVKVRRDSKAIRKLSCVK